MKKFLCLFFLATWSMNSFAQVVDSLTVETDLFAVITGDYENQFVNLGDNGFLLYGGEAKPKKKGFAGVTTNFKIYHYDTSFKLITTVVDLPQKAGPHFMYKAGSFVYFLIQPQLSGTGIAYLIKYDVKLRTHDRWTIHNNWKSSRSEDFVVVGNYLYVKYERAENGGYGVIVYPPYLEVYDLTQEKIKEVDLTFNKYEGYDLTGIQFVQPRNFSDTVYVQFTYKGDGKKNTTENSARRIQGFHNGRMLMDAVVTGDDYFLTGTYVIGCGNRVNFWNISTHRDSMVVSLSYLTQEEFVRLGQITDETCFPANLHPGWSLQKTTQSSFISVYQDLDGDDYYKGRFDKPFNFVKYVDGKKVMDTTSGVFKDNEKTILPYPYHLVRNENNSDQSEFIISSWQRLYSFKISSDNKLIEKYSIHLPIHLNEGIESPPLFTKSWEAMTNRMQLASVFDIQYAYSNYYYFVAMKENPGYAGYRFKLYKCLF